MTWDDQLNSMIMQIYAVAADREQLPEMFKTLSMLTKASAGTFLLQDANQAPYAAFVANHPEEVTQLYHEHYAALDSAAEFCIKIAGVPHFTDRIFSQIPELQVPEYENFARRFDHYHRLGIGIKIDDDLTGILSLHRNSKEGPFPFMDKTETLMKILYPHFCQAFRIGYRIDRADLIIQTFTKLRSNARSQVILYGKKEQIIFADESLEEWLADYPYVCWRNETLCFKDEIQTIKFNDLIKSCKSGRMAGSIFSGESIEIPSESGLEKLVIEISPGYCRGLLDDVAVIVILNKSTSKLNVRTLHEVFELTAAEAAVALALVNGQSVAEYAQDKGVSVATVRSQIRAIFDKLDVKRISELVRKVISITHNQTNPFL